MYSNIESGITFKLHKNDSFVEAFSKQFISQDGNESGFLKRKSYNPTGLIFQHLVVKKIVDRTEVNRMKNGYNIDALTSADI